MQVNIVNEAGHAEALFGMGLSHGKTTKLHVGYVPFDIAQALEGRADNLSCQDDGHNKFLESICVWIDIKAPRYFWQQFDTYRAGITKQSESTMHTLSSQKLTQEDFEINIPESFLEVLNSPSADKKNLLPESFLQRRIVCTNYKVLRHIIKQRHRHRLPQWRAFCSLIREQLKHPEYMEDI
jgi:hypothetical protein